MKYLYKVIGGNKYYTEKRNMKAVRDGASFMNASVFNDPDDCLLHQRELYAYGYELVQYTDRQYFLKRLRGDV